MMPYQAHMNPALHKKTCHECGEPGVKQCCGGGYYTCERHGAFAWLPLPGWFSLPFLLHCSLPGTKARREGERIQALVEKETQQWLQGGH